MTPESALILLSERLVGLAVVLQSIELLMLSTHFTESGTWRWSQFKKEFPILLSPFLSGDRFKWLLVLRILCVAFIIYSPHSPLLILVFLISLLVCFRFRGTFNGGSDYMSILILLALAVHSIFPSLIVGCLMYIGFQTIASYFIAGLVKAKNKEWWNGVAMANFTNGKVTFVFLSWLVIVFELSFPAVLLGPRYGLIYLFAAFIFHLAVFKVMGFNRFVFAWLAAFPSVYFLSLYFSL